MKEEKHLTIQFHLYKNRGGNNSLSILHCHPSERNYKKVFQTKVPVSNETKNLLKDFAEKHNYEYEYFQSKDEIHLKVPEQFLLRNSIKWEGADYNKTSSNKETLKDELSLINFMGDVVYSAANNNDNMSQNGKSTPSLLKGFIRTTKEKRLHTYPRKKISDEHFSHLRNTIIAKSPLYCSTNNLSIGIIKPDNLSRTIINPDAEDCSSFETCADNQLISLLAPNCKRILYTGISVLSALKTAITDNTNKPSILIIQYGNSRFDYTETEIEELNHQLVNAALLGISIITPYTIEADHNIFLGSTDSVLNAFQYSFKCFVNPQMSEGEVSVPVEFKGKKYSTPLHLTNPILWGLRSLYLNHTLNYPLGYYVNYLKDHSSEYHLENIIQNIEKATIIGYNNAISNSESILLENLTACFKNTCDNE